MPRQCFPLFFIISLIILVYGQKTVSNKNLDECSNYNGLERTMLSNLNDLIISLRHQNEMLQLRMENIHSYPVDRSVQPDISGVTVIQPLGSAPFRVYCQQGWTYLARRYDGSLKFNKAWSDYKSGFGNPEKEHFIGFEYLVSILLQKKYKLRIELTTWPGVNITSGYAEYGLFDISDARDNYRLKVGNFSGDAGDSLSYHNNKQFSTFDNDHDDDPNSTCAVTYQGAWWYTGCHTSNLFGQYSNTPNCSVFATCMTWYEWPHYHGITDPESERNAHGMFHSFKTIAMKIHPII